MTTMTTTTATTMTTLLLVEDDARIREALRLALADEGYRVVEAATGEQALERLAVDGPAPDVVLLDLMLPGMDGLEVCARIREHGDLPIIMVTARYRAARGHRRSGGRRGRLRDQTGRRG